MNNLIAKLRLPLLFVLLTLNSNWAFSQAENSDSASWLQSTGVIGTLILLVIVLVLAIVIFLIKLNGYIDNLKRKRLEKKRLEFNEDIISLESAEIDSILEERKKALNYKLKGNELGSDNRAVDKKGLIRTVQKDPTRSFYDEKKKTKISIETPAELKKIVMYYLAAATFWLVFGTFIGEFLGLKFVWPTLDHISWLSFGRLRPVHTNTVFWGWASLAMIGLGYFVIARNLPKEIGRAHV